MPKGIIKIRTFFNPRLEVDGMISNEDQLIQPSSVDYEIILKCNSVDELQLLCDEIFDIDERTAIDREYKIDNLKLSYLILTYA